MVVTDNAHDSEHTEPYNAWVLHGDAPRLNEACSTCRSYSLFPYVFQEFTLDGLRLVYIRVGCSNCSTWASDAMEIDYPSE